MNAQSLKRSSDAERNLGLLFAAAVALAFGVTVFALTHDFVLALAATTPIGVTLAIALYQRVDAPPVDPVCKASIVWALTAGVLTLIGLYFVLR